MSGQVDDERTVICHKRKIRKEHLLLFDHIEGFVLEDNLDLELAFVVQLVFLGVVLAEFRTNELDASHGKLELLFCVIFDGGELLQKIWQTALDEISEREELGLNEVGHLCERLLVSCEILLWSWSCLCGHGIGNFL